MAKPVWINFIGENGNDVIDAVRTVQKSLLLVPELAKSKAPAAPTTKAQTAKS